MSVNVATLAKEIRLEGEPWHEALARAGMILKNQNRKRSSIFDIAVRNRLRR